MMLAVSVFTEEWVTMRWNLFITWFLSALFLENVLHFLSTVSGTWIQTFNEISILLGIKCSSGTLDQICNIAILLFINFAHSMRNSRPAPTKEILKRFLGINFRNLCLLSKHFKKKIELVIKYNTLNAESFFLTIWV